ncbi:MAG: hydrogenase maturation nickel metallochaperone HypA [Bacillota bacterium]|nr:hydrogenase maturation nickel metallochaperone HypA [Bacillota bacterium]
MHELAITENIIKICSEEALKNKAVKVKEIKILVGELTGLIPESIQYYFDIASKGTKAEGAVLNIVKVPLKIFCNECKNTSVIKRGDFTCPVCEGSDIKLLGGNEFLIESMEVD